MFNYEKLVELIIYHQVFIGLSIEL